MNRGVATSSGDGESPHSVFESRESTHRLWSSRRCLVFFAISVVGFAGLIVAGFIGIQLEPTSDALIITVPGGGLGVELADEAGLPGGAVAFRRRDSGGRYSTRYRLDGSRLVMPKTGSAAAEHGNTIHGDLTLGEGGVAIGRPISLWSFMRWSLGASISVETQEDQPMAEATAGERRPPE